MRGLQNRTREVERKRAINAIDSCMARLFRRCPDLSGFSLIDEGELCVVDLALQPGYSDTAMPQEEIVAALFELLDERPDAFELLRGRTFARNLH